MDITANVGAPYLAGSASAAAFFDSQLSFSIQAIPEPSTYAAWAGVLALGLAAWRRCHT